MLGWFRVASVFLPFSCIFRAHPQRGPDRMEPARWLKDPNSKADDQEDVTRRLARSTRAEDEARRVTVHGRFIMLGSKWMMVTTAGRAIFATRVHAVAQQAGTP
jgi:hypothetical protein